MKIMFIGFVKAYTITCLSETLEIEPNIPKTYYKYCSKLIKKEKE